MFAPPPPNASPYLNTNVASTSLLQAIALVRAPGQAEKVRGLQQLRETIDHMGLPRSDRFCQMVERNLRRIETGRATETTHGLDVELTKLQDVLERWTQGEFLFEMTPSSRLTQLVSGLTAHADTRFDTSTMRWGKSGFDTPPPTDERGLLGWVESHLTPVSVVTDGHSSPLVPMDQVMEVAALLVSGYVEMHHRATVDQLTQTLMKSHGIRRAVAALGRPNKLRQSGRPDMIIMIDFDRFKTINDTEGHLAGDEVLRAVGGALKTAVHRQGDFVTRYGGDEFFVFLAEAGLEGAEYVTSIILERLRALKIKLHTGKVLRGVTASIGIAPISPLKVNGDPDKAHKALEAGIKKADEAVYVVKRGADGQGRRNRALSWRPHFPQLLKDTPG